MADRVPDQPGESPRTLVRSRASRVAAWSRPQVRVLNWLRSRGPVYNHGRPWVRTFMTVLNGGTLAPDKAGPVRRGQLVRIDFWLAPIRDVTSPSAKTAAWPRFEAVSRIGSGFRGMGLFTALPLWGELGDFRRFSRPTARRAYLGWGPPNDRRPSPCDTVPSPRPATGPPAKCWSVRPGHTPVIPESA